MERRGGDPTRECRGKRDRCVPVLVPGLRRHLRGAVRHGIPVVREAAARDRVPGGRGRGGVGAVPGTAAGRVRVIWGLGRGCPVIGVCTPRTSVSISCWTATWPARRRPETRRPCRSGW